MLRRAVELGVRVIDTAWYYGPDVANELVAEALAPYPDDLVLVTKLGGAREDDRSWRAALTAAELRAGCERDLRLLGVDVLPLVHLRWMGAAGEEVGAEGGGPAVSFDDALETMLVLQAEGKIQRIGLSNVTLDQLETALSRTPVASVSNLYSVTRRSDDAVLDRCAEAGIAYLPFFPLAIGHVGEDAALLEVSGRVGATPAQVALAWLLVRSPVMLPIPGTSSLAHLEENVTAAGLRLPDEALAALTDDV